MKNFASILIFVCSISAQQNNNVKYEFESRDLDLDEIGSISNTSNSNTIAPPTLSKSSVIENEHSPVIILLYLSIFILFGNLFFVYLFGHLVIYT